MSKCCTGRTGVSRRAFVHQIAGIGLGAMAAPVPLHATLRIGPGESDSKRSPVGAVLFDAFPIFDPRPVAALVEAAFPGRGADLTALWRARQFEYTWLRVVTSDYADFWRCTSDALRFATASLDLTLTDAQHDRLMNSYLALRPWPDVPAALHALRDAGVRLGFLSNFTPAMLEACIQSSGLGGQFDHVVSTDQARTFKPDPRAYQLGVDALDLPRESIVFAAFAGWDAAGAKRFGYPTFWVNRLQAKPEELGVRSDASGSTLAALVAFVNERR